MKKRIWTYLFSFLLILPGGAAAAQSFTEGDLRDIRPEGWLRETLLLQRNGLTGHPEALSYPYNTCLWDGEIPRMGTHGSEWWRYEQTAYYTDGLLRLGYLLEDEALVRKGEAGVSYTLAHPQANGRLGNPKIESLWPMAVFFRAMQARYYASGDPAILEALTRHYRSSPLEQLVQNRNIVNLEGMLWTAARTGDRQLVEKADSAYRYKELVGGERWTYEVNPDFLTDPAKPYNVHGVTMCEMIKLPILLYAATGKEYYKELAVNSMSRLIEEDILPDGVISSAEYLQGRGILNSHETCDITDFTWTLGAFLEVLGEARYADLLEKAVFNAGFGAVTPDWKALQYFSSVNQFLATGTSNHNPFKFGSTWMAYRPTHETECCAGNVHRFLPNFAARMWLRGTDGSAVAALYGPSRFRFNDHVTLVEETAYPYDETVTFRIVATRKERFTLQLRIPSWCQDASLTVNGKPVKANLKPGSFYGLKRKFKDGDEIRLVLPMRILKQDADGGVFFERGPLVYSYAIPTRWEKDETVYANMNGKFPDNPDFHCWSLTPDGPWNYALEASAEATVCRDCDGISLQVPARRIRWEMAKGRVLPQGVRPDFGGGTGNNFEEGRRERPRISREERERRMQELLAEKGVDIDLTPDLPVHPEPLDNETVLLKLVPYEQTQLRLTVFPVLR